MRCKETITTAAEITIGREKSTVRNHWFDTDCENGTK